MATKLTTKPVILDETGQLIVDAINNSATKADRIREINEASEAATTAITIAKNEALQQFENLESLSDDVTQLKADIAKVNTALIGVDSVADALMEVVGV